MGCGPTSANTFHQDAPTLCSEAGVTVHSKPPPVLCVVQDPHNQAASTLHNLNHLCGQHT